MKKKLIAIDLDGTLLNSASQISEFSKKILKDIESLGHTVVITTGRPFRMAHHYYKELGMTGPMINFNGALTHIPGQKWAFEHERLLDKRVFLDIVKREEDWQADFIAGEYRKSFYVTHTNRHKIAPELFDVETIEDGSELKIDKITKSPNVVLMQTRHQDKYALAEEMEAIYPNQLTVSTWGGPLNILECAPEGVNKAYALKQLLHNLNMDRSQLIAFGDEMNDDEMLAFAETGFAMKNANTDLLPFADQQLEWTNDQDGVAKQLQKLFL
ncbi:Cof-type HAD-IIB family hydrolase [Streptococcus ovuberis]|uniref:HAD family phosphatase n=1 Tax=Streptococcus ovuberis TaxID=1936207 RepID=A0A7X6RZV3_9STRE|nr:Cof-type HAD-IIB family hydrolase [Streptococcus ovuberis]NKZ19548.1 HAD family phosphatase [Streptococcus ovuberis]